MREHFGEFVTHHTICNGRRDEETIETQHELTLTVREDSYNGVLEWDRTHSDGITEDRELFDFDITEDKVWLLFDKDADLSELFSFPQVREWLHAEGYKIAEHWSICCPVCEFNLPDTGKCLSHDCNRI